jgi:hypothetical protein
MDSMDRLVADSLWRDTADGLVAAVNASHGYTPDGRKIGEPEPGPQPEPEVSEIDELRKQVAELTAKVDRVTAALRWTQEQL